MTISLRPVRPKDATLLVDIYASTREDELLLTDWDAEKKRTFCEMQFAAQDAHYREHYTNTTHSIILVDGAPAGRLYVARWRTEIRIMDIALLTAFRGRGAGTKLLTDLQAEAASAGKRLSIHVEKFNPALRLYKRLGFEAVADRDVYLFLEWRPESVPSEAAST